MKVALLAFISKGSATLLVNLLIIKVMEKKRQLKFSRQLQKDLSEIFLREGAHFFGKQFIGVSLVRVSPDLGYVKAYLTFLNEKEPEKLLNLVRLHNKELRSMLATRIKNEVRKIPEIEFFYDDSMDYVEKMDRIFDEIHEKDAQKPHPAGEMDLSGYKTE
jgi:ribosome-binding factor A